MTPATNPLQSVCAEAHALAFARSEPCPEKARKWVMLACILGSSLAFMDGTIVNVALPRLQQVFGASVNRVQWVLESYQLLSAALLLICGALGDHYGRKKAFGAGVLIFVMASIWGGLAPNIGHLIVARGVQGVGAALLIPTSLSLLASAYPEAERGGAIGTWSAWTGICAALGPIAGGWLIEHASWRLIFYLNVPIGAAVLVLLAQIPESRGGRTGERARLDWMGSLLITVSLAAIVLGLIDGPTLGWSSLRVVCPLVTGGVLLLLFLRVEATRANAMMPLSLFRSRYFSAANVLTFLLYASLGGVLFFLPFYLIQVRRFSTTQAGAAFLPFVALMFLFSSRMGRLVQRVGARLMLVTGAMLAGCGFILFGFLVGQPNYVRGVLPAVLVLGAGMTICVAPLTTTVMNSVSQDSNGIASGVNNAVSRVAGLLAIAVLGAVLQAGFSARLQTELSESRLATTQRDEAYAKRGKLLEARLSSGAPAEQAELARVLDVAFLAAFRRVMYWSAFACGAGAFVVGIGMRRTGSVAAQTDAVAV